MQTFLEEVVEDVWRKYGPPEDVIFILPSKRAGNFLRNILAKSATTTFFSPRIYSTESFVEAISGLKYASDTVLLFELYHVYQTHFDGEKESFYTFSKWGRMLLQDFNEVDRYMVPPEKIFNYLAAIQEVNHWYLQPDKTRMMKEYIRFWNQLETFYHAYTKRLLSMGLGHQGLVYRRACEKRSGYLSTMGETKHIFIGFNALNTAESLIIREILASTDSDIYWDADTYFLEDPVHDAGYFIRQHRMSWSYYKDRDLKGLSNYFLDRKHIRVIGVPKQVSQVKYAGSLLKELQDNAAKGLNDTAIVLGDESLLNPLLNAIPGEVEGINITMGYPLHKSPVAGMFSGFFELYLNPDPKGWFYKKVVSLLTHNFIQQSFDPVDVGKLAPLQDEIKRRNWAYVGLTQLRTLEKEYEISLSHLFFNTRISPGAFIERCLGLTSSLRSRLQEKGDEQIGLEYLYHFHTLFNQLREMVDAYPFVNDIQTLYSIYKELISSATVDFRGEPLEGVQVMGMLESRNLDFETVIITSVNEGILPSGKSNNSFIPFDVKREFGLPTYREKDAVYTYHFYRLLQRATNIYILYNTQADVLEGGEKSRFITQLLSDENRPDDVVHVIATPELQPEGDPLQHISKDGELLMALKEVAASGLSPTSLSNYIRNPIAFYKQEVLRIGDYPELEESLAAKTFGTVIHDSLESLYRPFTGRFLSAQELKELLPVVETVVKTQLSRSYPEDAFLYGKNLIAFRVIVRHITNFIKLELRALENHRVKILAVEERLRLELDIPGIDFPVTLKGKLDRVDEMDGVIRIIDYKTGYAAPSELAVIDWNEIITDPNLGKAFQLLCYALMYAGQNTSGILQAGIISFKNMNRGLIPFGLKEKKRGKVKEVAIDGSILESFRVQLYKLIREIYDPVIDFTEKET